ncbi:MAG: TonB-dependent receptor [Porticoccaceae bacterium]
MKKLNNYKLLTATCLVSLSTSALSEEIEEIIVSSSLIDASAEAIANPLHIISGDSVASDATSSLGATIGDLVGMAFSDYGSAVGQPVIRGMSGSRVKVLNNGIVTRDVSGLGPDHGNDVNLHNIQQIEVVRGPSSLLYSNGAIGGIVNIVDNTIAREDFLESELRLGFEAQSVNDGDSHDLSYQNNLGGLNFSFDYKDGQFGNFDIPHGAVIHEEEEDEEGEEEHDYLKNSDFESTSTRLGLSKTGDWGYVGLSFSDNESLYGIPFHGEHEHDPNEVEEDEDERIFASAKSEILNIQGSNTVQNGWLQKIDYHFRDSDYSHIEQHAEEEGHIPAPGEKEKGPTTFSNDAIEYGAIFDLSNDKLSQKVAVNFAEEDVYVIGDETFIDPTQSEELTLGYYVSKEFDLLHLDFGIRHDRINRKGSVTEHDHGEEEETEEENGHDDETEYFSKDINNTSYALSLSRNLSDLLEVNFGFSSVERAPTATELLMNGPHLATARFEVGNFSLDSETANNIDLTFNYENNGVFAALTFFQNDVDNYIYLLDNSEGKKEDNLIIANYLQQDAEFNGYELEIGKTLDFASGALTLSFARDSVSAKFANGGNVPRIVPARNLYKIAYREDGLMASLSLQDVGKQSDTATGESATDGFQMLNLNLSKVIKVGNQSHVTLSLFGKNLLDEAARNHSSFVKNEVPLPGRNLGLKASYAF